ncbi:MAG: hypothetical protein PHN75_10615 [Syntrophales bacterium]|nr:hypothetical protein [Syntrophales bacterium]
MKTEQIKEQIREESLKTGADVVGFAAIEDYKSERTPDPRTLLPGVKSLVVLGYRELDGPLDSEVVRVSMASRMATMDVMKKSAYQMAKFIEDKFKARAAYPLASYPLNMQPPTFGLVADLSLRHAAVAAGLGVFGRHNLVLHPVFGTRILFMAVLTDLPLPSDPPVTEELCTKCNICVKGCPAKALDVEGKTDPMKCLRVSQPWGIGGAIGYLGKLMGGSADERKALLRDPLLMNLYQASIIGFQYECFRCEAACPVGKKKIKQKKGRQAE